MTAELMQNIRLMCAQTAQFNKDTIVSSTVSCKLQIICRIWKRSCDLLSLDLSTEAPNNNMHTAAALCKKFLSDITSGVCTVY